MNTRSARWRFFESWTACVVLLCQIYTKGFLDIGFSPNGRLRKHEMGRRTLVRWSSMLRKTAMRTWATMRSNSQQTWVML